MGAANRSAADFRQTLLGSATDRFAYIRRLMSAIGGKADIGIERNATDFPPVSLSISAEITLDFAKHFNIC
jgi:hypothetical protein